MPTCDWKQLLREVAKDTSDSQIGGQIRGPPLDFDVLASLSINNLQDLENRYRSGKLTHYFGPEFLQALGVRLILRRTNSGRRICPIRDRSPVRPRFAYQYPWFGHGEDDNTPRQLSRSTYAQKRSKSRQKAARVMQSTVTKKRTRKRRFSQTNKNMSRGKSRKKKSKNNQSTRSRQQRKLRRRHVFRQGCGCSKCKKR